MSKEANLPTEDIARPLNKKEIKNFTIPPRMVDTLRKQAKILRIPSKASPYYSQLPSSD